MVRIVICSSVAFVVLFNDSRHFSATYNSVVSCLGSETEQGIFEQVLKGELDFISEPWPNISESAKDLVRRMLVRDPKKRLTAHEVLCEFARCYNLIF